MYSGVVSVLIYCRRIAVLQARFPRQYFHTLQATERLSSIISKHNPATIGNLYSKDFVDIPSVPGFYRLVSEQNIPLSLAFVEYRCFPPVHLFPLDNSDSLPNYLQKRLSIARTRRHEWLSISGNAFRLVNGKRDGLPALTIDVYACHAVICTSSSFWTAQSAGILEFLRHSVPDLKSVKVCAKEKGAKNFASKTIWGTNDRTCVVTEGNCLFHVNLLNGTSTGLFLDQRYNRTLVASLAPPGSTLLNLFAYTCAFAVVAAKEAGFKTTSVDISQLGLEIGRRNFKRSGLFAKTEKANHEFVIEDCLSYLKYRCGNDVNRATFDVVVCDPPTTFDSSEKRGIFSCNKDYDVLVSLATGAVNPGGKLILFCNSHSIKFDKWMGMVDKGLQYNSRPFRYISDTRGVTDSRFALRISADFFESGDDSETVSQGEPDLKGVIIEFLDGGHQCTTAESL